MAKVKYKTQREIALENDIQSVVMAGVTLANCVKAEIEDYDGCGMPKEVLEGWLNMLEDMLARLDYQAPDETVFTYHD